MKYSNELGLYYPRIMGFSQNCYVMGFQRNVDFPNSSISKESLCNAGDLGLIPGLRKIPWRRKWQPTPVFLPGESHGQRSLAGYSPWGCKNRTQLSDETTLSVPLPDSQIGKSVVDPRTFLTVWEFHWENYSAVCGSFAWWLFGGLNGNLLQDGLCHGPAAPRDPTPGAGHCWPVPLQETPRQVWLSFCGVSGCTRFCLRPFSIFGRYGVLWFCPSYHLAGASPLPLDLEYLFLVGSNIPLLIIVQ